MPTSLSSSRFSVVVGVMLAFSIPGGLARADLAQVKEAGVLRHLGIPYANFVTGSGDGMDSELMQLFAAELGVRYEHVKTDWPVVVGELTGHKVKVKGDDIEVIGPTLVRGDVIANGMTVIPWRQKAVAFATPTFPNQVWLVSRADAPLDPITPSGDLAKDIAVTKAVLKDRALLGKVNTCLDPALYDLKKTGARIGLFEGTLNELAPAVLNGESELILLDVPDALVALQKWPGQLKVIGPISEKQDMAPAFSPESPVLREVFNEFLARKKKDGTFLSLVKKYYPFVFDYYPDFFADVH